MNELPLIKLDVYLYEKRLEKMHTGRLLDEAGVSIETQVEYNFTREELITQALKNHGKKA